jgi:hypothetical protein
MSTGLGHSRRLARQGAKPIALRDMVSGCSLVSDRRRRRVFHELIEEAIADVGYDIAAGSPPAASCGLSVEDRINLYGIPSMRVHPAPPQRRRIEDVVLNFVARKDEPAERASRHQPICVVRWAVVSVDHAEDVRVPGIFRVLEDRPNAIAASADQEFFGRIVPQLPFPRFPSCYAARLSSLSAVAWISSSVTPGRRAARISWPSSARRQARRLSAWLGRRRGESHGDSERSTRSLP